MSFKGLGEMFEGYMNAENYATKFHLYTIWNKAMTLSHHKTVGNIISLPPTLWTMGVQIIVAVVKHIIFLFVILVGATLVSIGG